MEKNHPLKEALGNGMRTLWDLMVINWLWFLCSLPIITIGPATCALYSVALKHTRDMPVNPAKDFLLAFRNNFKPALLMGLLSMVILVIACGDLYFALQQMGSLQTLYMVIGLLAASVFLTIVSFAFPLQAMFENPLKAQLANAFKLAFVAPGKTISLWMITILPMLGASGPAYQNARTLRGIFDKVNGSPVIPE